MTRDDIIRMAAEAGITPWVHHQWVGGNKFVHADEGMDGDLACLMQFAALVAAAALAEPVQEPVATYSDIVSDGGFDPRNRYDTAPPQRKPLTDVSQEIEAALAEPLQEKMLKQQEQAHHDLLTTHSADCWRWHHDCAIAEVERLRAFAAHPEQAKEVAYAAGWYQSMQAQAKDGCAHCLHPLYCGIKCGVCGRSS